MLISTFLNADLNRGLMPSGEITLLSVWGWTWMYCLQLYFYLQIFFSIELWLLYCLSFYWVLKNDIHLTAESLMHHLSPYTNGINGAMEGVCASKWICPWRKCCVYFYWILRTTETFVLFQKHITDKASVWLLLKGLKNKVVY